MASSPVGLSPTGSVKNPAHQSPWGWLSASRFASQRPFQFNVMTLLVDTCCHSVRKRQTSQISLGDWYNPGWGCTLCLENDLLGSCINPVHSRSGRGCAGAPFQFCYLSLLPDPSMGFPHCLLSDDMSFMIPDHLRKYFSFPLSCMGHWHKKWFCLNLSSVTVAVWSFLFGFRPVFVPPDFHLQPVVTDSEFSHEYGQAGNLL